MTIMYKEENGKPVVVQEVDDRVVPIYISKNYLEYTGDPLTIPASGPYMWSGNNIVADTAAQAALDKEALVKSYEDYVLEVLNADANKVGYDSIYTAMAYASTANPFQAEGQSFVTWAGNCWSKCYEILNFIDANPTTKYNTSWVDVIPTKDELLAELPKRT